MTGVFLRFQRSAVGYTMLVTKNMPCQHDLYQAFLLPHDLREAHPTAVLRLMRQLLVRPDAGGATMNCKVTNS